MPALRFSRGANTGHSGWAGSLSSSYSTTGPLVRWNQQTGRATRKGSAFVAQNWKRERRRQVEGLCSKTSQCTGKPEIIWHFIFIFLFFIFFYSKPRPFRRNSTIEQQCEQWAARIWKAALGNVAAGSIQLRRPEVLASTQERRAKYGEGGGENEGRVGEWGKWGF